MRPSLVALRALGLGDLLTAVPAVRGLRRAFADHELVLATAPVFAPLVAGIDVAGVGGVDRLLPTESYVRAPMEVLPDPGRRPDVAVNLHGRGPQSRRALSRYRPRRLLAYGPDGPQWRDDEHEVARWCRLLAYYGIAAHPDDLLLPLPASRPEWAGAVVLHPGASSGDRCWPVDRFAALAGHLVAAGHRVLLSGDGSERRRCVGVARGAGLAPDAVLAGRTDIAELSALIAHAGLVVCGDTGVAHLATAYGTPSVVLFGPVSPALWGPPPDRSQHVALWHGPAGLARISVDEVIRVVHSAAAAR